MAQLRYEVWPVPGIAGTYEKKIAALRPESASGTLYRRQSGRGQLSIPADYDRLDEIISVDPSNHANDVASLIKVFRGSDLIQELLVPVTPNLVADQPAALSCEGVEAVMDWAVVECWDWDGTADFTSTVPDWIYGGRNLIPDLALGDLGSIREEWDVYLSGERYDFDVVGSGGFYTFTVDGNTTANINWDATRATIKSSLEALATVTEVSVVQADPDTLSFVIVFEDPKDLSADMTKGGTAATTLTKLNDGFDPSTNPTFTLTVDGQTTSALDWDATAKQVEGSPLGAQPGLEGLSNVNDVAVSGEGIASDPWSVTFYDPPDPTNFTATFAAGTAVLTKITEGDVDPSPVTVSQSIDASRNPTIHGCYDEPPIQVVTTPLDTGADWSLLVNATCQYAGSQIVLNGVTPGQIYQASINVRPTVTGLYTLVIRDEFENLIKTTTPRDNLLTAGSFQTLSIADVEIPEGVNRIIMRVAVTDPTTANWADFYVNWQGAEFREGQAATTLGTIMGHLLDDAQTDHASAGFPRDTIDFINKSFTDSLDTAGAAWADAELSVNIPRGMTYRKVLDRIFGGIGYEWNLTPTTGTPGEWDLNVWNPDGRGTDHSAADTPSLLLGQGTLGGSATRQVPRANRVISEGAQQFTTRARNAASEGTIGSREWYQADVSYFGTQAETWTDNTLTRFLDVSLQPRFEIADPPSGEWPVPVVDYGLADVLNVDLSDGGGKVSRSVEAISWRTVADGIRWGVHTGEAQFDAFPTGGFATGFAAGSGGGGVAVAPQRGSVALSGPVDEGVRRLLDEFDRLVKPERASAFVPGGAGGEITLVVAASDAKEVSKEKADYICAGADDQDTINEAIDRINANSPLTGRLRLTEGQYTLSAKLTTFEGLIEGVGSRQTVLNASGLTTGTPILELTGTGSICRDLSIQGSGVAIAVFGFDVEIQNCYLSTTGVGIQLDNNNCRVDGVHFDGSTTAIDSNGNNIIVTRCDMADPSLTFIDGSAGVLRYIIVNNGFNSAGVGHIVIGSASDHWIIANNAIGGQISSSGGADVVGLNIIGNVWTSVTGAASAVISLENMEGPVVNNNIVEDAATFDFLSLVSVGNAIVTGNRADNITDAVFIDGLGDNLIANNSFGGSNFGGDGVVIDSSIANEIAGNRFHDPGQDTTDTFDAIRIQGSDPDRNYVHGNRVEVPAAGNVPRYGINVAAGDCNIAVGNALGDPADYGTDAISGVGSTDTQWKYPDDPVYGDNFTVCEPTPS